MKRQGFVSASTPGRSAVSTIGAVALFACLATLALFGGHRAACEPELSAPEKIEALKRAPMIIRRVDEDHVIMSKHSESVADLTGFEPLYPGRSIFAFTYEAEEKPIPPPAASRHFEKTLLRRLIDSGDLTIGTAGPLESAAAEEGKRVAGARKIKEIVTQELRNHNQHVSIKVPFTWDERVSSEGETFWALERAATGGIADTLRVRRILRNLQGGVRDLVEQAIETAVDLVLPGSDLERLVFADHPSGGEYGRAVLTGARLSGIPVLGLFAVVPLENGDCFQIEYLTDLEIRLTKEAIFLEMVNSMRELK